MVNLVIIITENTEEDYDGVEETTKNLVATLDLKKIVETYSISSAVSDEDAKTDFKTKLTNLGYVWDTET